MSPDRHDYDAVPLTPMTPSVAEFVATSPTGTDQKLERLRFAARRSTSIQQSSSSPEKGLCSEGLSPEKGRKACSATPVEILFFYGFVTTELSHVELVLSQVQPATQD